MAASGLSLFSGGLDSMLAVCVLREIGCHVEAVAFSSPFFDVESAKVGATKIDVPLRIVDFTDDITSLVASPPHGFGGAMNPCIDCHSLMIRRAGEIVRQLGWDFVSTGEVLNQRPMSQNRRSLEIVAKCSGCEEILIRPLCARHLDPTKPELEGKIDRSRLLDIEGRCRQRQLDLAAHFGIADYPSPAGGCRLTEKLFCKKLADVKEHGLLSNRVELELLNFGRHFRLPGGAKAIVGRNSTENEAMRNLVADGRYFVIRPIGTPGPTTLLESTASEDDIANAKRLCAAYCDTSDEDIRMRCFRAGELLTEEPVRQASRNEMRTWML